jgi:hypothetical protein
MNAEDAQPHIDTRVDIAEKSRVEAEGERQLSERSRQLAEQQRTVMEQQRQVGEKERELGERLRGTERTGERFAAEYSTRSLLERIVDVEAQLVQLTSRLGGVEELLKAMQEQLQQLKTEKT